VALHPTVASPLEAPKIALLMLAAGSTAILASTITILALAWRAIRP